ncbi:MAG: TIGR04551 family protein, partial [Myxococcales bacterium]|nr:TIGR04551 family protein [Myxococcales bacterium]
IDPLDIPPVPETLTIDPRDLPPLHAAADVAVLGAELAPRKFAAPRSKVEADIHGVLRARGESLYNLDLDRGLDPSGHALFPVPLDGGQRLSGGDLRFRSDLAFYAPGTGVAVKLRVDVLDDVALGSTPEVGTGRAPTPAASPGQTAGLVRVERAWGEALTPFGVLAAGRMGAHWGLGIAANGGDCDDCDGGDAADRVAFLAPLFGHLLALSYDFSWSGPVTARKDAARTVELAESDDVTTVTVALLNARTPATLLRRAAAGRATVEYGAYVSHRWQADDVPAAYLPVAVPVGLDDPAQLMARDFSATSAGGWLRMLTPGFRLEAEAIYAHARVGQTSLIPGVELTQPATSNQVGLAVETEAKLGGLHLGVDGGFASGDDAPGFGAFPVPGAAAAQPGDLDGPQADPPGDTTVDNFRFHPDYRIDRILFREIIGTITDAAYLRPHVTARLADLGHAWIEAGATLIASWAIEPSSTPSGARALGVEVDPTLTFGSRDGFRAALEYAVLLPGAAFDNPDQGLDAAPAQLWRVRVGYVF